MVKRSGLTCQEYYPNHPQFWCRACREAYAVEFPAKVGHTETCRAWLEGWYSAEAPELEAVGRANCPAEVP